MRALLRSFAIYAIWQYVIALDAATGKMIWHYTHKPEDGVRTPWKLTRGLAILGGNLFLAGLEARADRARCENGKRTVGQQNRRP
jgi:glucose dehydrogenase